MQFLVGFFFYLVIGGCIMGQPLYETERCGVKITTTDASLAILTWPGWISAAYTIDGLEKPAKCKAKPDAAGDHDTGVQ